MNHHRRTLLLAAVVCLSLALILLAGCSVFGPKPAIDPLADYRPALHAEFTITPEQLASLQSYSITVKIDTANMAYTGTLEMSLPVTADMPLHDLYFRLYPNLGQFGGNARVATASVNDMTVNYGYEAENTAVHLHIPTPLEVGSRALVRLAFSGEAPLRQDGAYSIFGQSDGILSLTNFYPILAGRRSEGWALELASPRGDVGFHDTALYRVEIITAPDQIIAASGTVVTQTVTQAGEARLTYVQGPAREFSLVMSPDFATEETTAYGTLVRSYHLSEHADAARSALNAARIALQIYSDRFGPYPYSEMSIVEAPLTYHGMEFPGMSLIGMQDYDQFIQDLEKLVVHEVAHHWWYDQVGSDQVLSPWLDEGLAEFSMYYYYLDLRGAADADWLRHSRWSGPVLAMAASGGDMPIGGSVVDYAAAYETVVYAKGALFFATLRDELGPDLFDRLLKTYVIRYRWKIATPADFRSLAEEMSGRDLADLFTTWVDGTD